MSSYKQNPPPIPSFYRIFFTSIDPLIALSGAYLSLFDPETILASSFPRSHHLSVPSPSHAVLLDQAAGAFLMMAFLMIFMLRTTNDMSIWKLFEFAILITDGTLFFSLGKALATQGRLGIGMLRWEEWGTVGITGFVTVMRIAFLMELGFQKKLSVQKEKKSE